MTMPELQPSQSGETFAAPGSDNQASVAGPRDTSGTPCEDTRPLYRNSGFWGLAVAQSATTLNVTVFKQLVLLLATPTAVELAAGTSSDRQGEAQFIFTGAILMFLGIAGFLSDRISKRTMIIGSKAVEIAVMLLGVAAFYYYDQVGIAGTFAVLFLMGVQNAFFQPAKYGIFPEMLQPANLPRANGVFLLLSFLTIFIGFALAGALLNAFHAHLWAAPVACVAFAIVGTVAALPIPRLPAAKPMLRLQWSSWSISKDILKLLRRDRELLWATIVVAVYWTSAVLYLQAVNALGRSQLGLSDLQTSLLAASSSLGVAFGSLLGGYVSRNRINRRVAIAGSSGLAAGLFLMALPGGSHRHLLGFWGSIPVLIASGVFAGMFIVPVQVVLQSRPSPQEKGRMIAVMNQCNLVGILCGAVVFKCCVSVLDATGGPRSAAFALAGMLILPIAIFYRPKDVTL